MLGILKRALCLVLISTSFANYIAVAEGYDQAKVEVYYNGGRIDFPAPPELVNGVVMVPMRKIFETIGSKVYWGGKRKTITSVKGDNLIMLKIGSKFATSFGNGHNLEVAPYLRNGMTFVPLRFISESLGLDVTWEESTRTVNLRSNDSPNKIYSMPFNSFEDIDATGDVSTVSLYNLEDQSKTKVVAISNYKVAQLSEERPYQNNFNPQSIELNASPGKQMKAIIRFDLSQLKGKHIKAAYLRLVNQKSQEENAVRTVYVQEVTQPWESDASWIKTHDDVSEVVSYLTTFRVLGWEPSWFIDITNTVKSWIDHDWNNGVMLTVDRNITLFNLQKTGLKPFLIVEYADMEDAPPLTYKAKLKLALDFLGTQNTRGAWSDLTAGTLNAQVNADRLGLGPEYLNSLIKYFNDYITPDGTLRGEAGLLNSYYYGSLGKVLIYMYQRTGDAKYQIALEKIRRSYDNIREVDGIYLDDETYQGELAYLGLDFLAAYGEAFGDKSATDIAISQINKLYDILTSADTDGVPFTLLPKTESYTGSIKGVGWGRGVGWLYAGMGKLLTYQSFKLHPDFPGYAARFQQLSKTLKDLQDSSGMWHSVIQVKELPLETSGTAMIALGMEYGFREGVLSYPYKESVNQAINALQRYTRTGVEMGNSFPDNQDLKYTYPYLSTTRHSYGFWMELLTTRELYRKRA